MKLQIGTHDFFYALRFFLVVFAIFFSGNFVALGIGEYFSAPKVLGPQIEANEETAAYNAYFTAPAQKPIFLPSEEIIKKKNTFAWDKKEFLFVSTLEEKISYYKNGAEQLSLSMVAGAKENGFFDPPSGIYSIQKKIPLHASRLEGVKFPWAINLYGNFLIHGWPILANNTQAPATYIGGGIRLTSPDAKKLYNSVPEKTPVLLVGKDPKDDIEFSYFRKTNRPHSVPETTAAGVLAADLETGHILFEKNKTTSFPTASVTKLLTAIIASEQFASSTMITITREAFDTYGNSGGFSVGETFYLKDLLYALLLPSSNDAAKAIELGIDGFIDKMNKKAQELGMEGSFYRDSSGLSEENITTAADLVKLLRYMHENTPELLEVTRTSEYITTAENKKIRHVWKSLNWPAEDKRFLGGKVGWTEDSLQTMAGIYNLCVSEFCGRPVAIAVLGSRNRIQDIRSIITYLEKEFIFGTILTRDSNLRKIPLGAGIYEAVLP